ncbi:hypothetical protein Scel_29250 [Streptomyces cellostaticus]|nr:hypothetical protein Scel_29250 [Streptomyces cellostaticus]
MPKPVLVLGMGLVLRLLHRCSFRSFRSFPSTADSRNSANGRTAQGSDQADGSRDYCSPIRVHIHPLGSHPANPIVAASSGV